MANGNGETEMTWLDERRALRDRYDAAINAAVGMASGGSDGRSLVYQRIDTLVKLRNSVDNEIAIAEANGAYATVAVDYA